MNTNKIRVGDLVEVSPVRQNNMAKQFTGKVEMVFNTKVLIHSPSKELDHTRLPLAEQYWLHFENGMFRCKALINRCVSKDDSQIIDFKLLDDDEGVQKREFYRLPCHIPTKFTLIKTDLLGRFISTEIHKGVICDLSGGGVKIIAGPDLELRNRLFIPLHIDNMELFLTGEIRAKYSIPNAANKTQYGIVFSDISGTDQDRIVQYLFRQQMQRSAGAVGSRTR